MTSYGKAIIRFMEEQPGHYTAEQVYLTMKAGHPKLVLATVYNNLKSLSEEGHLRKISIEGEPDRYELNIRHDHLLCRQCRKLSDITLEDLTDTLRWQTGLSDLSYDLKINYLCNECRTKGQVTDN